MISFIRKLRENQPIKMKKIQDLKNEKNIYYRKENLDL